MPMTAFIGVRISWLMVARKALFAALAFSAAARASCASRNRRTFSMAIIAWSAKDCARSISSRVKGRRSNRMKFRMPACSSPRTSGSVRAGADAEGSLGVVVERRQIDLQPVLDMHHPVVQQSPRQEIVVRRRSAR